MANMFEMLENPHEGWETREIKQVHHIDAPTEWLVQLMKVSDGTPVEFRHANLHIAWVRAIEAVRSHEMGLNHLDGEADVGQSRS
jgi:hypothetical protein